MLLGRGAVFSARGAGRPEHLGRGWCSPPCMTPGGGGPGGRPTSDWQLSWGSGRSCVGALVGKGLVSSHRGAQGTPSPGDPWRSEATCHFRPRRTLRCAPRTPASTSVWEEAGCGTSSRLRWEMGWDGAWKRHIWPPLQLSGSSGCSQPQSPDRADHTGDRALRELTWVLLSNALACPGLPQAGAASYQLLALTGTGTRPGLGWKPSHGLLCAPTAPGGGQRCTSRHTPINPCAGHCPDVQPTTSLHGLRSWRAVKVDTVDGPRGVPRQAP